MKTILSITAFAIVSAGVAWAQEPAPVAVDPSVPASTGRALSDPMDDQRLAPVAACQNVTIRVNNQKNHRIKALKVEYKSVEDGKTRTENFSDEIVNANSKENVATGQSLQYVEGHEMEWVRLFYKPECNGTWTTTLKYKDTSFDKAQCVYGKTYRIDLPDGSDCN